MASIGICAASTVALVAAVLALLRPPVPWPPFPDRLAVIDEEVATIDNTKPYDSLDKWAPNGTQAALHLLNPARVAYFDGRIRAHLGVGPFRVLDMGCGGGLVSNALANLPGYDFIQGVDLSAEALEYATTTAERSAEARAGVGRSSPEVRFSRASIYEIDFPNASFDIVIMSDVLEHLLDVRRALREAFRLLRPGGLFLYDTITRSPASYAVSILGAECVARLIQRGTHDWRLFILPEELEAALGDVGFQNFTHKGFNPSVRAFLELAAFSYGLMPAGAMAGGWRIEPPSASMVSYIGQATKA